MKVEASNPDLPLDERYFHWLYNKVAYVRETDPSKTYWGLFYILHTTEFEWFIPNDDNRVEDGKALREEYVQGEDVSEIWMSEGCSIFEFLIAVARRMGFQLDLPSDIFFWELLINLNLADGFDDSAMTFEKRRYVDDVLTRLVERKYEPNGVGGIFPLMNPPADQRRVEVWYQMSAYLMERIHLY